MLLLMGWKDPQEELNLDSKLREFFSWPIPNLRMADKSVHFTRFLANLVPKVLYNACAILPSALWGYIAPKSLLLIALSMPIYSKGVYILTSK